MLVDIHTNLFWYPDTSALHYRPLRHYQAFLPLLAAEQALKGGAL